MKMFSHWSAFLHLNSSFDEYVLYLSEMWRENLLRQNFFDEAACKTHAKEKGWLYIGCSEDGVVSFLKNMNSVLGVERYLETSQDSARIVKIVFTDAVGENDSPICRPYYCINGSYISFKYKLATNVCIEGKDCSAISVIDCDAEWIAAKSKIEMAMRGGSREEKRRRRKSRKSRQLVRG